MTTKKWTEEEEEFLKANYEKLSNLELAERLNLTKNAVQKKLARMGLKRSEPVPPPSDKTPKTETAKEKKNVPASAESHFFSGNNLFYKEQNYERAIEEYLIAEKEESDKLTRLKARYLLAESYVKVGKIEEAVSMFKKVAKESKSHYLGDSAKRRVTALADYIVPTV